MSRCARFNHMLMLCISIQGLLNIKKSMIYGTDRIFVELYENYLSISIGIAVVKAVGIAYLVTRKVFFCSATRTSSSARILKVFWSELRLDMQMASPVWWQEMCFFCSATRTSSITKSHLVPYIFIGRSLPKQVFYCRITDYCVVMSNFFLHMELTYFRASIQCISSLLSWLSFYSYA